MTDILKWVKDKGIFITVRIGKKMFDPANQKRTTVQEDIKRKREERKLEKDYGFYKDGL